MYLLKALIAQLSGALITLASLAVSGSEATGLLGMALMQGGCAAAVAWFLRSPVWWLALHLVFAPAIVLAWSMQWPAYVYLAGFVLLCALSPGAVGARIPLFSTNAATARTVLRTLPRDRTLCVVDLGCGTGAMLRRLARARPDCRFEGIEYAPLACAIARWRTRGLANCHVRRADFWRESLAGYDVVYAFLSPAPMARLADKLRAELAAGAMMISNSFPLPDVPPARTIVARGRIRPLYYYSGAALRQPSPKRRRTRAFARHGNELPDTRSAPANLFRRN